MDHVVDPQAGGNPSFKLCVICGKSFSDVAERCAGPVDFREKRLDLKFAAKIKTISIHARGG